MKFRKLYHTIRHLKPIQIAYQIKYRLVKAKTLKAYTNLSPMEGASSVNPLTFKAVPTVSLCWNGHNRFEFLNLSVEFPGNVDWNYELHGKLWNYNLQYANYLLQPDVTDAVKLELMKSQYLALLEGNLPLEPYPVSLRSINMMRWISTLFGDNLNELHRAMFAELKFLSTRLEYHLMGNHLLENAFALIMGGAYFDQKVWVSKAQKLLERELDEQILDDGGHFERSPMYHQIIFFRLLELIDWYAQWPSKDLDFEGKLRTKATDMASWLKQISFCNGDIPHFNDSTDGIAFPTRWLLDYAKELGITSSDISMKESGYRSYQSEAYEIKIDLAQIGPPYQPGHAHADALSFILYCHGNPLFVEQGTSTYQIGVRRDLERSTEAHNTVVVEGQNQSEVWGGFRVGKRANVHITEESRQKISAWHDGYRHLGLKHERLFKFTNSEVIIEDKLSTAAPAVAYFHLHSSIIPTKASLNTILLNNGVSLKFDSGEVVTEPYQMASGFNKLESSVRIGVKFKGALRTHITFQDQ